MHTRREQAQMRRYTDVWIHAAYQTHPDVHKDTCYTADRLHRHTDADADADADTDTDKQKHIHSTKQYMSLHSSIMYPQFPHHLSSIGPVPHQVARRMVS